MFARMPLTTAIRAFQAYHANGSIESLYLTCKTAQVLFRQRGLQHDLVRTLAGHLTDDVSRDGPPGPPVSFSLLAIDAGGPAQLIETLRRKLRDDEFLPSDIEVAPAEMIARGVSHGRAVWFQSAADGGSIRAIPVETVPLEPTCAAG